MGSLKISKENERRFAELCKENLGHYWKRAAIVHRNYGDIFSKYIVNILGYRSYFGKETRDRNFDVIISILEIHWEVTLRRQIYNVADPDIFDLNFFYPTIKTFYFIYKKMRCVTSLPGYEKLVRLSFVPKARC